ncbi:MAG: peptide transporter [Planctomycetes bacterium]|nr:peptide transporter [Planctomycetota bacterium]
MKLDKDLQLYRDMMPPPDHFEDGFGIKTVIGALFIGFLMVPASMYLSLFMGGGLGGAAQWVTVILFAEIVKRSMKSLKQQEIYVLFYMTGMVMGGGGQGLLWSQYFVRSPAAIGNGVAAEIPSWVAPQAEVLERYGRTFLNPYWVKPIMLMIGMMILGRIDHLGLGYALYRLTAHVEKLPFPLAPAGAMGITALAETKEEGSRWKWRCFCLGSVLGLGWGVIYTGIPAVTGALFGKAVQVVPIPWLDLTPALSTKEFLPAVPLNIVFDAGALMVGMIVPFWAAVGGILGFFMTIIMNPMLYRSGQLTTWKPGMGLVDTLYSNNIDFYLSFGIGLMLAIFVVSMVPVIGPLMRVIPGLGGERKKKLSLSDIWGVLRERNIERGDLSILTALSIYVFSTISYILICCWMMPGTPEHNYQDAFPWVFFLGFGFIYTPIISYINAKLAGMLGMSVSIPLVREASYILCGYKGAAIWFAPIPINDYGGSASGFRVMELTGTRLSSMIKTEFLLLPVVIVTSLLFSELIWRMAAIPSEAYPYTKEVWHLNALNQSLTITSTLDGASPFLEAIKPHLIAWGAGAGLVSFGVLSLLNLPTLLVFGFVGGLGQVIPGGVIPTMIGALIGKFYMQKRFGREQFLKYMMIVSAGFGAGMGLIGMAAVAIALIAKSVSTLGY